VKRPGRLAAHVHVHVVEEEEEDGGERGEDVSRLFGYMSICARPQKDNRSAILSASTTVNRKRGSSANVSPSAISHSRLHLPASSQLLRAHSTIHSPIVAHFIVMHIDKHVGAHGDFFESYPFLNHHLFFAIVSNHCFITD